MINVIPLVLVLGCVAFGLALYGHMRSAVVVALVGLGIAASCCGVYRMIDPLLVAVLLMLIIFLVMDGRAATVVQAMIAILVCVLILRVLGLI
jgi:hypothetical protein